jgi:hypothetical protein
MTAKSKTPYMRAIAAICTAATGINVKISTRKIIGRKYSPVDLLEST